MQVAYTSVPRWWLGLGGVIFGAIGDFIALGLTSQALATALGGATTLWANVVIARYWLKEELNKWDVFGVLGIDLVPGAMQSMVDYNLTLKQAHSRTRLCPVLSLTEAEVEGLRGRHGGMTCAEHRRRAAH